jgi:hypothetical protein
MFHVCFMSIPNLDLIRSLPLGSVESTLSRSSSHILQIDLLERGTHEGLSDR